MEPNNGNFYQPEFITKNCIRSIDIRHVLRSAQLKQQKWDKFGSWLGIIGITL